MVTIALDAMGGDNAPKPEVEGALKAAKAFGIKVILVGREDILTAELRKHEGWHQLVQVRHASEQITMEDSAGKALRNKKDSSVRVASRLVREGVAQGLVSAGNTGAVMATAKIVQGMLPGVDRPALAAAFPTKSGRPAILLDVGANADCTPRMLAQFAVMGNAYSRVIFRNRRPRVGLLSIGEEEHKGNSLTHEARPLIKTLPDMNFVGNVEGRDLFAGTVDVVISDGFVGNVALKVSEGVAELVRHSLKKSLGATLTRKFGAFLARRAFLDFKKHIDYSEYGGAPLLGLNGICVICHGRSNANAIKNAIRVAKEFAEGRIDERIASEVASLAMNSLAKSVQMV